MKKTTLVPIVTVGVLLIIIGLGLLFASPFDSPESEPVRQGDVQAQLERQDRPEQEDSNDSATESQDEPAPTTPSTSENLPQTGPSYLWAASFSVLVTALAHRQYVLRRMNH